MIATTRLCISVFLAFSLVGCGGSGSDTKKSISNSVSSAPVSSAVSSVATSQSSPEGSSSSPKSSLNSSQQSSSSSAISSTTFTIEFKPPVIGAQASIAQKIGQFFIPAAQAASTVHLKPENFALVRINLAGVVQETAQLPVGATKENTDGSWVINWEGKKSIDWLVVADITKPLSLNIGESLIGLRKDLIYAPVTSDYIDVDVTSTEAYMILLRWSENVNPVGGDTGATFENTLVNVQDEEVVTFFENLINASQLKIDEQALVANTIEAYRTQVNQPISKHLFEQIKDTTDPKILSLAHKFQDSLNTANSIVGAWTVCDWASGCGESWLVFTQENTYVSIQTTQPDEGCKKGIEIGTYTLNQMTGAFKPTTSSDTNGHCGVSDAGESASLVVNGNQLVYKEANGSSEVSLFKVADTTDYRGVWILSEKNRTEVLVITSTDFVFGIYDSGVVDVEQGSHSYNSTTGAFVVTQFKQDTNSTRGFSGATNIKFVVNGSTLSISTALNPSNPQVFSRLQ